MGTAQQRRLFTTDEYDRLADVGILRHDDRVELLDGDIIEMTPIGIRHAASVDRLLALLQPRVAGRAILRVQNPIRLDRHSEPQPVPSLMPETISTRQDTRRRPTFCSSSKWRIRPPNSIATSKFRSYARSGIPEVWRVDLRKTAWRLSRSPHPTGTGARSWRSAGHESAAPRCRAWSCLWTRSLCNPAHDAQHTARRARRRVRVVQVPNTPFD